MIETFWLIVLVLVLIWYVVVTFLVAKKGFGSLRLILKELSENQIK